MGLLKVRYEEGFKQGPYTIWFNPGVHNIEEASTYRSSFEGCVGFVVEQFCERARPCFGKGVFKLKIEGDLPIRQKRILESIVQIYNWTPKLYGVLSQENFRGMVKESGTKLY